MVAAAAAINALEVDRAHREHRKALDVGIGRRLYLTRCMVPRLLAY